ncbi:MAG: hypothetical protein E7D27_11525 [Clostridium celatum]|nr:hypothetical protein [Clostridium celatum]
MNKVDVLTENLVKIDLLDDYWNIQKKCRKDFYNLRSLKIRIDNISFIVVTNRSKEEIERIKKYRRELSKRSEILLNKFELHDKKLKIKNQYLNEDNGSISKDEVAIDKDDELYYLVDIKDILTHLREAIILRSNINMLQKEILEELINEQEYIDSILIGDEINGEWLQYQNDQLIKKIFNHSTDEDRIDTYEIDIKNRSIKKDLMKDTGIQLPVYEKCKNVDFDLNYLRDRFKDAFDLQIKICDIKYKNKKEEIQECRNRKQHNFNIMITIATIVATIIYLIDLFITIWDKLI